MGNLKTPQPIRGGFAVILLNTHVIFALMRPHPEPWGLDRADGLDPKAVAITDITEAEILHGLARMPDGRRKQDLQQSWDALMAEVFTGRVWLFTSEAAHWTAQLLRRRERAFHGYRRCGNCRDGSGPESVTGLPWCRGCADIGLELINPWDIP